MQLKKRMTETDIDNIITESFLFKRFKLLAVNMFEWDGLDSLNTEERHVEGDLFDEGISVVFEDETLGLMCLRGMGIGSNVRSDPTHYRVYGYGYTKEVPADKCVVIENNKLRMPTCEIIQWFTKQLFEIVRTRDTNIKTLKLPFLIPTTDDKLLSSKKLMEEINNNNWALVVNAKTFNIDETIKVLQTGVKPFTAELTDQYHDILNEALTYLGINNANTDKKERLITDEANANNQFIDSCAQMFLEARQRACEKINKMFGTNVSVKLRNELEEDEYYEVEPLQESTATEQ